MVRNEYYKDILTGGAVCCAGCKKNDLKSHLQIAVVVVAVVAAAAAAVVVADMPTHYCRSD